MAACAGRSSCDRLNLSLTIQGLCCTNNVAQISWRSGFPFPRTASSYGFSDRDFEEMASGARAAWLVAAAQHAAEVMPYLDSTRRARAATLQQLADALTARGVRAPRGGERWHPWQIRRVLIRANKELRPQRYPQTRAEAAS